MLISSTTQERAAAQPEDGKRDHASVLQELTTERPNEASQGFDTKSALEIVRIINHEDGKVAAAVKKALPEIAEVIDQVARSLRNGGLRMPAYLFDGSRTGAVHHGRRTQGAGLGR